MGQAGQKVNLSLLSMAGIKEEMSNPSNLIFKLQVTIVFLDTTFKIMAKLFLSIYS
jgi:hypothetical protein